MSTPLKPFGITKEIINECGFDISYFYEDLIFVDHSLMIVQFDENNAKLLKLFFNRDCEDKIKTELSCTITQAAAAREMEVNIAGKFYLTEKNESKELDIHFI